MRTVVFAGNSRIDVRELPAPEPGPGEVLLKVEASAICGSEMSTFRSPQGHPTNTGVNLALNAVRKEGRFVFAGAGRKATINPWSQFLEKEITAYGVWYFVDRDYHALLDLYRQGLRVGSLITHRFSLDDAPTAYDLFSRGKTSKVVFMPSEQPATADY